MTFHELQSHLESVWIVNTPGSGVDDVVPVECRDQGTGVVLHMLSCLPIDGRFGLTAIGRTQEHAQHLYDATRAAVNSRA
ncbi:MAG: peptide ligase PGM1-related protein [Jiangellaceae bacterium]